MTSPITVDEYKRDIGKSYARVYNLASSLRGADLSGSNPTIRDIRPQIEVLRRLPATASPEVVVGEANKLIVLLDKTLAGSNLTTDQRATFVGALGSVTSSRESSIQQPTPSFKQSPGTITPETWAINDMAITNTAKEVVASLRNAPATVKDAASKVEADLSKSDRTSLYHSMLRLQKAVTDANDPSLASVKGKLDTVDKPITENMRASNGKTLEAPPKAAELPPKPVPAAGKLCEPITHERWGVRFRFLEKPPEKQGECESKGDGTWDLKDWFLQLLPAMQSVIPRQGARDVPNVGPGLSFKFKNNMVKHKVPGSQPVYQMMGVDSAIITFVGTFTGDGGLGYINKVDIEDGELKDQALQMLEAEASARRAGQAFPSAKKYGGEYSYGKKTVNAMFNPIYHVRNRALAPGGDTSSALVGSNSTGWLMDNSILRQGFFERDGCPGQCPPPSWKGFPNGHMDEAGGKFAWGDFGTWPDGTPYGDVGTRSQMDTHKLAHIAAYLDAYHEMVSFYKFAVQGGKLMEITINLRKTHDGLKPRVADPRMKGKLRSDTPDPLRDMHTGNPTFKGYLKTMSTWAQYSDRVWYVMEFEVVDHGLQGKKAVNLTNKVKAGGPSSSGGDGGAAGEAPGSSGSDDPMAGVGVDSTPQGGGGSGSTSQALVDTLGEGIKLPTKDGTNLILQPNGYIVSEDGNTTLSYNEAHDRLHSYDLVGRGILYNWFTSSRVVPYGNSLVVRNNDGSGIMLRDDGAILQYPKHNINDKVVTREADPQVIESIRAGDMTGLNDAQRAAVMEWRDKYYTPKQSPTPSTTPAPTPPPSIQKPIEGSPTPLQSIERPGIPSNALPTLRPVF